MAIGSSWTTVAAAYAVRGAIDDALVAAATAAGVGVVQVADDGSVIWSDEAYRVHGRPRWRRVRSVDDVVRGLTLDDAARLRSAYFVLTADPEVEVRYAVRPDQGPARELVLHALDRGVAIVHRAAPRPARPEPTVEPSEIVVDVRDVSRTGDHLEETVPVSTTVDATTAPIADAPPTKPTTVDTAPVTPVVAPASAPVEVSAVETLPAPDPDIASAVLSVSPDLIVIFDIVNRRVVNVAGSDPDADELLAQLTTDPVTWDGTGLSDAVVHPDDRARLTEWRLSLAGLEPDEVRPAELRFSLRGVWRWRELRASAFVIDENDQLREIVILVRDVHERIEAGLLLAERERAFREVFDSSPVGLAVLDDQGRFAAVNDAFCRLVGRTRENVQATVYEALLHHEDRAAAVASRSRRSTEGGVATATERRLVRSDGTIIWVRTRSSEIAYDHEPRTLLSVEDVTSAKAVEDRLRHDALHDALTGLPNRRLIIDRTERALSRARRTGTRLALYFIDLDDLKRVNDTHPWQHRAGDVLITSVAAAIRASLRDTDTLGRLGGDEFVAICEDAGDDATVTELGERILAAVRTPYPIGSEVVRVGASIGVAIPDDHETAEQLLSRADSAMYRAKSGGGSRLVRADDGPVETHLLDLPAALARNELSVHYRPVVSIATGAVLGVEGVVRCELPGRGLLPEPEVRAALDTGAGVLPVTHWALRKAVADVRTVSPTRAAHLSVWLTMPARAALAGSTRRVLDETLHGPDGDMSTAPTLVLGLHQRDIASLMRRHSLLRHLGELTSFGPLGIGVVDFTADTVPLGTLRALDAVSVSFDPALLEATRDDRDLAELTRSLVAGAEALGVITIAAGVESQEHLELARWLGVDAVSGDLIGPLAPLESWSQLLLRGVTTLPTTSAAPAPRARFEPRLPDPVTVAAEVVEVVEVVEPVVVEAPRIEPAVADPVEAEIADAEVVEVVEAVAAYDVADEMASADAAVPAGKATAEAPRLLLGDIGESLAYELGFTLPPASTAPAPHESDEPPTASDQAAPASSAPEASHARAGAFAGFTLPPSPFLMLRRED